MVKTIPKRKQVLNDSENITAAMTEPGLGLENAFVTLRHSLQAQPSLDHGHRDGFEIIQPLLDGLDQYADKLQDFQHLRPARKISGQ